jgi:hypothetical protein
MSEDRVRLLSVEQDVFDEDAAVARHAVGLHPLCIVVEVNLDDDMTVRSMRYEPPRLRNEAPT